MMEGSACVYENLSVPLTRIYLCGFDLVFSLGLRSLVRLG